MNRAVLVGTVVLLAATMSVLASSPQSPLPPNARQRQALALRAGDLHAAAMVKGSIEEVLPLGDYVIGDLKMVVDESSGIYVGVLGHGVSTPPIGSTIIHTQYPFIIKSVINGASRAGDALRVDVIGGHVVFSDGTWAEQTVLDESIPIEGDRYVVFLAGAVSTSSPSSQGIYHMAGGGSSEWTLFHVSKKDVVEPVCRANAGFLPTYRGMKLNVFESAIKKLIGLGPSTAQGISGTPTVIRHR